MMLPGIQREFAKRLQEPETAAPVSINAASRKERETRFAVHRNNFVVNLVDALEQSFPVTAALVGTAFFREMARERVLADPPRSPVLLEYAQGFPEWVASYDPAVSLSYLPEVTRIEALRIRSYNAEDAAPIDLSVFQKLASKPEQLMMTRVILHPACEWMSGKHAAYSIWHAHQNVDDMHDAGLEHVDMDAPEAVVIARPSLDVVVSKLPSGGFAFLNSLHAGDNFGEAFQQALISDAKADPTQLFSILIEHGLVVALDFTSSESSHG